MRIPIGPHEYDVKLVHGFARDQYGNNCLGFFDATQQVIYISDAQAPSEMAVTLGHELMHAWRYHLGCNTEDEEELAEMVGMGFAQFIFAMMTQLDQTRALLKWELESERREQRNSKLHTRQYRHEKLKLGDSCSKTNIPEAINLHTEAGHGEKLANVVHFSAGRVQSSTPSTLLKANKTGRDVVSPANEIKLDFKDAGEYAGYQVKLLEPVHREA